MQQLVSKRGLWEPHHTQYSLQYGDKGGIKQLISKSPFLQSFDLVPIFIEINLDWCYTCYLEKQKQILLATQFLYNRERIMVT